MCPVSVSIAVMLKIRLQRVGRTNIPAFRLVLTDSKNSTKSGRYKEVLGSYDPVNKTKKLDAEKVKHWISMGAQTTPTVHNFLISEKVITGKKVNVLPRKKPIKKEEEAKAEAPATEAKPAEAAPAEASPAT